MQEKAKASNDYSSHKDTSSALLGDDREAVLGGLPAAEARWARSAGLKKILVATDFSACSNHALKCAAGIAVQCHAELTLLHVIDVNAETSEGTAGELMDSLWRQGSTRMKELASTLSGQVEVGTILDEGLPWDIIVERSNDFDLLIVGENRSKTRWKLFSHRTPQRVMENARGPVLIIPEESPPTMIGQRFCQPKPT